MHHVVWVAGRNYRIHEEMTHTIDLDARSYTCRVWWNNELPFTHTIAATDHYRLQITNFYEPFTIQAYRTTYTTEFRPVPDLVPPNGALNRALYIPRRPINTQLGQRSCIDGHKPQTPGVTNAHVAVMKGTT
ncbi:hypothetical protein AMTR_s00152p00069420 [Amborella trichopoda]|uniref:Uncharacterized protein n=1 Tax=Amborella trichopoda TaxID=13333 RepID=W1PEU7_AMBTC|nr:hypothetical protein AMTR_s00152p00069420 [Amborella trichopoda]